jgi:ABC-type molybdate transport system substrate-binding protein
MLLQIVAIREAPAVGVDYGLAVIAGARPEAIRSVQFVLSDPGDAILKRYGFTAAKETK